ncbi:MAG: hypothetical protein ACRDDW_05725 [Candidatus Rhabdochlamydia sp.]
MKIRINQNERITRSDRLSKPKSATLANTVSKVSRNSFSNHIAINQRSSPKINKLNFAAKCLVSKEELAPYFTFCSKQHAPAAVAVAVITILLLTSSKRPDDIQLPIDLENTSVSGLNINQLLEIRENSFNK